MNIYNPRCKKTLVNKWIPESPGVYFLWSKYDLLYIGKAKNLQKRIAQHLGSGLMVQHIINPEEVWKVSIIFTKDEFDAARLEKNLIDLIPTKHNKFPFFKQELYYDWKFGRGVFQHK